MANQISVLLCAAMPLGALISCATPFDSIPKPNQSTHQSIYRLDESDRQSIASDNGFNRLDSTPESFVRYALFHSPEVERSYQQWRRASRRIPQVSALPDPRIKVGFFLDEVETRVGPQQARIGFSQTFPWIGKLKDRQDAAAKGALAAWYQYQATELIVTEQVLIALNELNYLDAAIATTKENLTLLSSFEQVVRAKYRVGAGSHPQLIRVQLELAQIQAGRPVLVASLNSIREPRSILCPLSRSLIDP